MWNINFKISFDSIVLKGSEGVFGQVGQDGPAGREASFYNG